MDENPLTATRYNQEKAPSLHIHHVPCAKTLAPLGLCYPLPFFLGSLAPFGSRSSAYSLPTPEAGCASVWNTLSKNIHIFVPLFYSVSAQISHDGNELSWNKKAVLLPPSHYLAFLHHICHEPTHYIYICLFVDCLFPPVGVKTPGGQNFFFFTAYLQDLKQCLMYNRLKRFIGRMICGNMSGVHRFGWSSKEYIYLGLVPNLVIQNF